MTAAREAAQFVESVTTPTVKARTGVQFVESVTTPTVKTRSAVQFVEIVVGGAGGGWSVGSIRIA